VFSAGLQRIKAERVLLDILVIDQRLMDQHVDHAECESGIRTRPQRNMFIALFGGQRAIRINGNQLRTAAAGLLRAHPEMHARHDGVASPDQDQLAVLELFEMHADARPVRIFKARCACCRADRPVKQ
jgi:hypothetical protein